MCVCRLYSASFHFTTDPINPPIFRTFRSLWLLQTFGWPSRVAVWHPPRKSAQQLSSTYPLLLFHTPGILLPLAQSCEFVSVCLLSLIGPLFIPLVDHRQSNSTQSSCHLFSPAPILCFFHLLFSNFKFLQFIELYLSPLILF